MKRFYYVKMLLLGICVFAVSFGLSFYISFIVSSQSQECYGEILIIKEQQIMDGDLWVKGTVENKSVVYYFEGESEKIDISNNKKIIKWCFVKIINDYRIKEILNYGR